MCAIVDANVKNQLLASDSRNSFDAGSQFRDWLESGTGKLILGGSKLRAELFGASGQDARWWIQLKLAGVAIEVDDRLVDQREQELRKSGGCQSDDEHIIALAQISGARLLYSEDEDLHADFRNKNLVDHPRGRIYPRAQTRSAKKSRAQLLRNTSLCNRG